jgi:anthranilate phosphoribosyltransferase
MGVRFQLVGVYASDLVTRLADALGVLGTERALVVHGRDGLDELTTTGPSDVALLDAGKVRAWVVDPAEFAIPPPVAGALRGGDADENAAIIRAVLDGETGAHRDIVLLNAAAALWVANAAADLAGGLELARASVDEGRARGCLEALTEATVRLG